MKKYISLLAAWLVCAGLAVACGDDASSGKAQNGDVCNSSTECESGYCSSAHLCADKPDATQENGSACESHRECLSGYCGADYKCAATPGSETKKGAIGDACSEDSDCESDRCASNKCAEPEPRKGALGDACTKNADCESNHCVSNKCAAATSEAGDGAEGTICVSDGSCAPDLYCVNSVCASLETIGKTECSSSSASFCAGNNAVTCRVWSEMTYVYDVAVCPENTLCLNLNEIASCAERCSAEEEGVVTSKCDPDQVTWDGFSDGLILFTCTKVDDAYYRVASGYKVCDLNNICLDDSIGCQ